jgi:hypothetical protein
MQSEFIHPSILSRISFLFVTGTCITRYLKVLQSWPVKLLYRVLYLEVLPIMAVVHVTDVQVAVYEVSNVADGSMWGLQKVRYHTSTIVRVK